MDPAEYARRRKRVLQAIHPGTLLVVAAPVAIRNNGVEHEYRQESDPLEAFVAEFIEETDDGHELPVREIVKAYNDWAEREGLKSRERLGSRRLQSRLKAKWPERHRRAVRNTPTRYAGLRLVGGDA